MGITALYQMSQPVHALSNYVALTVFGISYYSIVLFLNVLLTFMIVIRLFLHSRNMGGIMGVPTGSSGPYNAIIVMLVESCALYSVVFLLFIGLWAAEDAIVNVFQPILMHVQVRGVFRSSKHTAILRHSLLVVVASRSLLHSSSPYGPPNGVR